MLPGAGGNDTPVGAGAGNRAWLNEARRQGVLTKTGETLVCPRKTLAREMYERSTSVYESMREKSFQSAGLFI